MSFCGGPLEVATEEEAEKLMSQNEKDSANGNTYDHATSFLTDSNWSCNLLNTTNWGYGTLCDSLVL